VEEMGNPEELPKVQQAAVQETDGSAWRASRLNWDMAPHGREEKNACNLRRLSLVVSMEDGNERWDAETGEAARELEEKSYAR
jgi:hypothetical protein